MIRDPGHTSKASDIRALTGETPLWDETREMIWWIDVQGQLLIGLDLSSGKEQTIALPAMPGLVALADDGNLIMGLESGLWHLKPETLESTHLTALPDPDPRLRINDGKPDPVGGLWFGIMDKTGSGAPIGSIVRRDASGTLKTVVNGLVIPNAICFSPDGARFYYTDTPTRLLMTAAVDLRTGDLGERSALIQFEEDETPDGMVVDEHGDLWIALIGRGSVGHYSSEGERLNYCELPVTRPTMPCFAGTQLNRMFITSQRRFLSFDALADEALAGHLLELVPTSRGLPPFKVRI